MSSQTCIINIWYADVNISTTTDVHRITSQPISISPNIAFGEADHIDDLDAKSALISRTTTAVELRIE